MKRRQVLRTVLALFVVLASATATPALAKPNDDVHYGSMGETMLFIQDHPLMAIEVMDIKRSPVGPYDCLIIMMMPDVMILVTDNEDFGEFIDDAFGVPEFMDSYILVDDAQLEVWRRGKTLFAELTVNVTVEPPMVPQELTVDPLSIVFEGFGGAKSGTITEEIPGTELEIIVKYMGFNAFVTIVAHMGTDWECEWKTLGFAYTQVRWTIT